MAGATAGNSSGNSSGRSEQRHRAIAPFVGDMGRFGPMELRMSMSTCQVTTPSTNGTM